MDQYINGTALVPPGPTNIFAFDHYVTCPRCAAAFRLAFMLQGVNYCYVTTVENVMARTMEFQARDASGVTVHAIAHPCSGVAPAYSGVEASINTMSYTVQQILGLMQQAQAENSSSKTQLAELRTAVSAKELLEDRLKWAEEDAEKWRAKADEALRLLDGIARAVETHHPDCVDCRGALKAWRKDAED